MLKPEEASAFTEAMPVDTLVEVTPAVATHVLHRYGLPKPFALSTLCDVVFLISPARTSARDDQSNGEHPST